MPLTHLLNGDCLAEQLRTTNINQDFIVCRECLIDGDLNYDHLDGFYAARAKFISDTYNVLAEDYINKSVREFEKIGKLPVHSEVCLWFENDLFCQANMWFVLTLLSDRPDLKLYRVFPVLVNKADTWKGFGMADSEKLEQAYLAKVSFKPTDVELGKRLWTAYKNSDFEALKVLSKVQSHCFGYLEEVCQAQIDRFPADKTMGRPDKLVREIIENQSKDFARVFMEFSKKEGIYGFGDAQLKTIYDRQMQDFQ